MKTTRLTVEISCDAPGCQRCVLAQAFTTTCHTMEMPAPSSLPPEGWRERRTFAGPRHACSAECERALIDAAEDAERMEAGPLHPERRYELQAVLDSPAGLTHCHAILARDVPRRDWRVTHADAEGVRRWTVTYEPGAAFDPFA